MTPLRLGTRSSQLALWQAHWVQHELEALQIPVEIVPITTSGDHSRHEPIAKLGAQGVFTKEIQRALLNHDIDLAVHSMKDLPTDTIEGLTLAAVPKREIPYDVFVSPRFSSLEDLPSGARFGTGSLRRKTQLLYWLATKFPQKTFEISDIRGNVETRLKKLDAGEFDALILAEAGLKRLGFADRITLRLTPPTFLPAVGQGALALETRVEDTETLALVQKIDDAKAHMTALAERSFLSTLEGGCLAPIAAFSSIAQTKLRIFRLYLHGRILSLDGQTMFEESGYSETFSGGELTPATRKIAVDLGRSLAQKLLKTQANDILQTIKNQRLDNSPR